MAGFLEDKLVQVIESRADQIARRWYRDLMESSYAPSIKNLSEEEGLQMATDVYRNLGYWLQPSRTEEVEITYERFGHSLYHRGFRMEEVIMILVLIKRYLWLHLLEEGLMSTNLEVYQALELNNKVVLYFDRAIYFALLGYKEARARETEESA